MIGLSWINHIDAAATVLSATSSVGDNAVENLANPIVGRRHRTTDLNSYGGADFGANKTIGAVALVFPRDTMADLAGTVRHRFDADGGTAGTGALLDSTAITLGLAEGYGYHLYKLASPIAARYWRWTFAASGVDYIDTGRAWAGEWWQPSVGISLGHGRVWGDLSRISASARSGAEFVDERPRQQMRVFGLDFLDADSRDDVTEMQRLAGISGQILACFNTAAFARETILGRLAETTAIIEPGIDIYSKAFRIRESL